MRDAGVPRGVYTSSVAVFSDTRGKLVDETYRRGSPWLTLYDYTKWKAHYEVAEPMIRAGLPLVVVQPGLVYGPGDQSIVHRTFLQYLRGKLPIAPRQTAYCWGYVDDTARGHVLAMDMGRLGESYIIAGPLHTPIEVPALAEPACAHRTGEPRFHASFGQYDAYRRRHPPVARELPLREPARHGRRDLRRRQPQSRARARLDDPAARRGAPPDARSLHARAGDASAE
jgi:nucleoside-diphosphate-sugar epimerase